MRYLTALSVLAGSAMAGCGALSGDFRPEAGGPEGQISIVVDSTLWQGPVGETLHETLGAPIPTLPSREPNFALNPVHLTQQAALDWAMEQRNVLFAGILGDTTSNESRWLYHRLSEDARNDVLAGTPALVARRDEWRRRQQVYYLIAATADDLLQAIEEYAGSMVYTFNTVTRERMYRELFDIGRQRNVEQYLMDGHGFAVNVQHDYVVAVDTAQFVWLRRILSDSWRSLFVYYQDRADPSSLQPDRVLALRDALTREYIQGTSGGFVEVVDTQPITVDSIDFRGRFGYEIRGLWEMVGIEQGRKFQFGQGGAFLLYAFYDPPTQRIYLIDGMLFAPGYPKREFLRQLEVIAHTFRTSLDVEVQ